MSTQPHGKVRIKPERKAIIEITLDSCFLYDYQIIYHSVFIFVYKGVLYQYICCQTVQYLKV